VKSGPVRTASSTYSEGGDMEPILVATGARPFSRLILTRGDEDVNFDHVERELGFRFFRRLSIRVKTNFLRNQKRQISGRLPES